MDMLTLLFSWSLFGLRRATNAGTTVVHASMCASDRAGKALQVFEDRSAQRRPAQYLSIVDTTRHIGLQRRE